MKDTSTHMLERVARMTVREKCRCTQIYRLTTGLIRSIVGVGRKVSKAGACVLSCFLPLHIDLCLPILFLVLHVPYLCVSSAAKLLLLPRKHKGAM